MRFLSFVYAGAALGLTLALNLATPAHAAHAPAHNAEPATLGFGVGYFDVMENNPRNESLDLRLEYRAAYDMLKLVNGQNSVVTIRPFGGIEATTDGALYGLGGFVFDIPIGRYFVLSPNVGVGAFYRGDGKRMGSFVEFRSTLEAGVRFDDASRLTLAFGHISNASLTKVNHGAEVLSVYYHLPIDKIFSH